MAVENQFPAAAEKAVGAKLNKDLVSAIAKLLDCKFSDIESNSISNFIQLGGDSVKALQLTFDLDTALGDSDIALDLEDILNERNSVQKLSQILDRNEEIDDKEGEIIKIPKDEQRPAQSQSAASPPLPLPANEHLRRRQHAAPERAKSSTEVKQQQQQLAQLIQTKDLQSIVEEASRQIGCPTTDIEDVLPITDQQTLLWLASQRRPEVHMAHWTYNLPASINVEQLRKAWLQVIEQSAALRTRIVFDSENVLYQAIVSTRLYENICNTDKINPGSTTPPISAHGKPLFTCVIQERQAKERQLHIYAHHSLYDRWSIRLIFNDLREAYACQEEIQPAPRPSYVPFLAPLTEQERKDLIGKWQELIGETPPTPVPELLPGLDSSNASKTLEMTMSHSPRSQSSVTEAELVIAAWSWVCCEHSHAGDISFGLTVWGRDIPIAGMTEMAFPTFSTLPFCTSIQFDISKIDFLKDIKARLKTLRKIQRIGYGTISSINDACRQACRYNSIVVVQSEEPQQKTFTNSEGLMQPGDLISFDLRQGHPLILECTPSKEGLSVRLIHNPDCLPVESAKSLLSHFAAAYEAFCVDVEKPCHTMNLFSDEDYNAISKWTKPSQERNATKMYSTIEHHAEVSPSSVAIWTTQATISYKQLIDLATNFSALLQGKSADKHIGLCFHKSMLAVVAQIGVSMSGRVFIPMDPGNPPGRLKQIAQNAHMSLLVCSESLVHKFQEYPCPVLVLDEKDLHSPNEIGLKVGEDLTETAYIIFTSGSTGTPKGVVIQHEQISTSLDAQQEFFNFGTQTRTLQFSSLAFDMSIHEIYTTLSAGGTVCIPTEAERFELHDFITRAKVNYSILTPSVAVNLSDESLAQISTISLGGEALPKGLIERVLNVGSQPWIVYGPTETTVIDVGHKAFANTNRFNLGYSFGVTAWIVNANDPNKLAAVGMPGELAFSGYTLAAGYYEDDEETDAAFRKGLEWTKRFPEYQTDRVYLTGDLARYNLDGSIQFLGRLGGYTKIAGNRVDLDEIVYLLKEQTDLTKVSVQICEVKGRDTSREMLVCFFADSSTEAIHKDDCNLLKMSIALRARVRRAIQTLRQNLPTYMIPYAFLPINQIPLSTSGKLDGAVLHELIETIELEELLQQYGIDEAENNITEENVHQDNEDDSLFIISNTTAASMKEEDRGYELTLKKAWSEVLSVSVSSLHRNSHFTRMGGDSLRAMKLASVLRRFHLSLSVADILKTPVFESMTDKIKQYQSPPASKEMFTSDDYSTLVKIAQSHFKISEDSIETISLCSPMQIQMLVASEQASGVFVHRDCFRLKHEYSHDEVEKVCRTLIAQNELLRTKVFVEPRTGRFIQTVLKVDSSFNIEVQPCTLQEYLAVFKNTTLGLGRALHRLIMLKSKKDRPTLVWEMHHCIYDGYSHKLLLERLQLLIEEYREPKSKNQTTSTIRSANTSYQKFIRFLQAVDQDSACKFWSDYLQGASQLQLNILKSVSGPVQTNARRKQSLAMHWEDSEFTAATYVRTAYALLLSRYAASSDVNFAATFSGRDLPVEGIEEIAGPTFTTIPLRVQIDAGKPLRVLLSEVQQSSADCASRQLVSFEDLAQTDPESKQICQFKTHLLIQSEEMRSSYTGLEQLGYQHLETHLEMQLQIPLNLVVTTENARVNLEAIFNDASIDSTQVELLLDQFGTTLRSLKASDQSLPVDSLLQIGPKNKKALMSMQPDPKSTCLNASTTIPDLLMKQVEAHPNQQAIYSSHGSLTYNELYNLSQQLSAQIAEKIGKPEQIVAFCYEKCANAIIAQLAILMAGHAFVPIDPNMPESRWIAIFETTGSPLIVASPRLASRFTRAKIDILVPEHENSTTILASLLSKPSPSSVAYILFTSGTTGAPKGVVVEHGSICRTIEAYAAIFQFSTASRALLFASFTFDASILETWSILSAGGTLCIPNGEERISSLTEFIQTSKTSFIGLTPTAARLLEPSKLTDIKTVLFCGETCRESDRQRWKDTSAMLVNAYGPTEASVNTATNTQYWDTDIDDIGTSLGGGLWIANPDNINELLPVGCPGELIISGPVLAKEYLKAPDLTAERFIHPEWPVWTNIAANDRVFRTGDLSWLDACGRLHMSGRNDGQMKVNGVRVESSEIESVVQSSHAKIKDVTASTFSQDEGNTSQLALYFVTERDSWSDQAMSNVLPLTGIHAEMITAMDQAAKKHLPTALVPSFYIPVSCIPQSVSGKIDRKLLEQNTMLLHPLQLQLYGPQVEENRDPSTRAMRSTAINDSAMPQLPLLTDTENTVRSLWSTVLGIDESTLTVDSHFEEVGGDSVAAIRLKELASTRCINLPVVKIFSGPRLGDMASSIERDRSDYLEAEQNKHDDSSKVEAFELEEDVIVDRQDIDTPSELTAPESKHPEQSIIEIKKTLEGCFHPGNTNTAIIITGKSSKTISHASLNTNIKDIRQSLRKNNIGYGTRIAIALSDPYLFMLAFLALTLQCSVAAPLNHNFKAQEFDYYYQDLHVEAVILSVTDVEEECPAYIAAKQLNLRIIICQQAEQGSVTIDFKDHDTTSSKNHQQAGNAERAPMPQDLALILHTSGTTGKPKAVPLTHGNLARSVNSIINHYSLTSSDRGMVIMPLFHIHGLVAGLFAPLASGGTIVFSPKGGLTPSFHKDAAEHAVTWYTGTPTLHKLAVQIPKENKSCSFRFVRSCSSRLEKPLLEELETLYSCPVVEAYAMTEAAHQICSNPIDRETRRIGSVGIPTGVQVKVLDDQANEMKNGDVGEICIKGENVTEGYLDNETANSTSFTAERFFRTGDLGFLEDDGFVTLTGRIKEQINKGGEKISPVEIDEVVNQHPDIAEAATFTIPDDIYGENVGVAVVAKDGASLSEANVKDWIGARLVQSKVPKKVFLVEKIPKTSVGKLQRRLVAQRLLGTGDAELESSPE